jgi:hypothetical protein
VYSSECALYRLSGVEMSQVVFEAGTD